MQRHIRKVVAVRLVLVGIILATISSAAFAQGDLDQYGGYLGLGGSNTSGYFRTEKIGSRWWLITPDNHAFWSTGMDVVVWGENWSSRTPPDQPPPPFFYYPYAYNVYATLGTDPAVWAARVSQRLSAWKFNTLGAWCDITRFSQIVKTKCLNFTGDAANRGVPKILTSWGAWKFVDVFDPGWVTATQAHAQAQCVHAGDPWFLGYFSDNEIWWRGNEAWEPPYDPTASLPDLFIKLDRAKAGKQHWVYNILQPKYATVEALNAAYGTAFTSWDTVDDPTSVIDAAEVPSDPAHPDIWADKVQFMSDIAERYYSVTSAAIRARDPDHLILGDRWALWTIQTLDIDIHQVVWQAAGRHIDVFTVNMYWDFPALFASMHQQSGLPLMCGEWGSGCKDANHHTPWGSATQTQRCEYALERYVNMANAQSGTDYTVVGIHWFQYFDEPPLGRPDGEKYTIGVVNIEDEPFTMLVDSLASMNRNIYDYLLTGVSPLVPAPLGGTFPRTASASSERGYSENQYWWASYAADGARDTAWSSASRSGPYVVEYLTIDLGAVYSGISHLCATPRVGGICFPSDFSLLHSTDNTNWTTIPGQAYTDYPNPGSRPQDFNFSPITARYLRMRASKLVWDGSSGYYFQLAELSAHRGVSGLIADDTPTFQWDAVAGADTYTLEYSAEPSFPEGSTVIVPGIASTSFTPTAALARGEWWWTVQAVNADGDGGHWSALTRFIVTDPPQHTTPAEYLACDDLAGWRNYSYDDAGGDGLVYAFLDAENKTEGGASAKVTYTIFSWNTLAGAPNTATNTIAWRWGGDALDLSALDNLEFDLYPGKCVDHKRVTTTAAKYLWLRITDAGGATLDTQIDPGATLTYQQWHHVSIPLGAMQRDRVTGIELYIKCGATDIPWDQRIWFNFDDITQAPSAWPGGQWALGLRADAPGFTDTVICGTDRTASDDVDAYDVAESTVPPYLSFSSQIASGRYAEDYRPPIEVGSQLKDWNLTLETDQDLGGQSVAISWPDLAAANIAPSATLYLIDRGLSARGCVAVVDMHAATSYSFTPEVSTGLLRRFTLRYAYPQVVMSSPTALTAGWNLLSLPEEPVDPRPAIVFNDLIGDPIPIAGSLYRYDRALRGYVGYHDAAPADFGAAQSGEGYWLWVDAEGGVSYQAGALAGTREVPLPASGWHLIGSRALSNKHLAALTVYNGGTGVTQNFAQAVSLRWVAATLYGYVPTSNGYFTLGFDPWHDEQSLRPWRGYWLATVIPDLTLKVPSG